MPALVKQEPGTGSRANRTATLAHARTNDAITDSATEQFERDRFERSAARECALQSYFDERQS